MSHLNDKLGENAKRVRRTGVAGIVVCALALLACELPIILALIGLGGLSTAVVAFKPPYFIEVASIVLAVIGAVLLITLAIRRVLFQKKCAES